MVVPVKKAPGVKVGCYKRGREGGERACMLQQEREERGRVAKGEGGERACMSRERIGAEGKGEDRACMSREECCGRRGRKEGVYVAGAGGEGGERA